MLSETYYTIEFSISNDFEIEDISIMENETITNEEVETLLKKLMDENKLSIGERCEGSIDISETTITITYRWCSDLGEDWDSDIWEDEELIIPND